jgi:hypothetical protein
MGIRVAGSAQPRDEVANLPARKTGANLGSVSKLALFVVADDQSAEFASAALSASVTAHHKVPVPLKMAKSQHATTAQLRNLIRTILFRLWPSTMLLAGAAFNPDSSDLAPPEEQR